MSLYFVYTPNVKLRRADLVFFFEGNSCRLTHSDRVPRTPFEFENIDLDAYKQIVDFAEEHKFSAYEIMLSGREPLEEILKFLSEYLFDRDLSIGLLTADRDSIDENQELLNQYGITVPNPYIARDFLSNYAPVRQKESRGPIETGSIDGAEGSIEIVKKPKREPICVGAADAPKSKKKPKVKLEKTSAIELDESFHEKFIKLLIESGKDNVEVYKKAGITRQVFSRIISERDMIPTKLTLISLCIGLELPLKIAKDLMVSAGYSLSRSIMLDAIVMKYIREEIYDFELINSELDEYGCQLLGWHPRDN